MKDDIYVIFIWTDIRILNFYRFWYCFDNKLDYRVTTESVHLPERNSKVSDLVRISLSQQGSGPKSSVER